MVKGSGGSGDQPPVEGALALAPPVSPTLDVDVLYGEHAAFVARVIVRMLGPGPHVEDLLQDTFVVAWRKRGQFDHSVAVTTWLFAIASNLCRRHRRGAYRLALFCRRLAEGPQHLAAPDAALERHGDVEVVQQTILTLPYRHREVFVLYELEGMDGPDIAAMLGVPVGTVWSRLHKARKTFEQGVRRRLAREGAR